MTKEEYLEWKHHPLTKQFHQYLKDYRQQLAEKWAKGVLCDPTHYQVRCKMAQELVDMHEGAISEFYGRAE